MGGVPAPLDADLDEFEGGVDFRAAGRIGTWGILLDFLYLSVGSAGTAAPGIPVSSEIDLLAVDLAVSYRVVEQGLHEELHGALDAYLGARIVSLDLSAAAGTGAADGGDEWVDPILGAELRLVEREKWELTVRGDVGGFGIGSDLTWSALLAMRYRFTPNFSLALGYRWLDIDYESGGGAGRVALDALFQGPFLEFALGF